MPRTALTVQTTSRDGLTTSYTAGDSANGHEFSNTSQDVILHIKNDGAGSIDATFITPKTVDGQAVGDRVVTVGIGVHMMIGPFSNSTYGSGSSNNDVYIDLDDDTSVTLAAIKVGS